MRTWKSAFAYLLFAYFAFASAISLAVQHYSKSALTAANLEHAYTGRSNSSGTREPRSDAIPTPPPALATTTHTLELGETFSDLNPANDIPFAGPKGPLDEYYEVMTRALGR